ncbi:gamma-glutamylcyclotransferase family protein [Polaromonas jejuensis]|uniref:Gamma-glutamylcyclotransferase n=1 Tax=Polaromonas jejuensis TaxID=457502 RepID=A0ABW0QFX6_9BURK|nr:gamma-glutamylcyclotransferase family protein [Polaromonas jejuensis]
MKPETTPPLRHVFVYGTLRRGEERDINRLLPAPRWVGRASVAGVMHDLGAYPGLVLGGPGRVLGEVYEISAELEQRLDEIEEVWPQPSGEYAKREAAVQLDRSAFVRSAQPGRPGSEAAGAPEVLVCLLYELAPARTVGKPVIASGDWVRYRAGRAG